MNFPVSENLKGITMNLSVRRNTKGRFSFMDGKDCNKLWQQYVKTPTMEIREKLIIEYAGLVKIIAGRMSMYLGYNVEYDDLVGYGVFGLIDAIDKFDYDKGVKFETYASLRIKGAILDQIRKMDWIPRSLRLRQKKMEAAEKAIEDRFGRKATDSELAEELGISVEECEVWQSQTRVSGIISLDDYLEQGSDIRSDSISGELGISGFESPEMAVQKEELKESLATAISGLTEKEQKVIALYYYEELTLKEISHVLSVSESRVSQLHTKALSKLKDKLGDYMDVFTRAL